jgi:hypothetical protein
MPKAQNNVPFTNGLKLEWCPLWDNLPISACVVLKNFVIKKI